MEDCMAYQGGERYWRAGKARNARPHDWGQVWCIEDDQHRT